MRKQAARSTRAARTYAQMREGDRESARLHLESVKRLLLQEAPGFID